MKDKCTNQSYTGRNAIHTDRVKEICIRVLVLQLLAVIITVMAGCGTLRGTISTIVHRDLSVSRHVEMVGTGMFANLLAGDAGGTSELVPPNGEDTDVNGRWEDGAYHLAIQAANITPNEWMKTFPREEVKRDYYWVVSYYRYTASRDAQQGNQPAADSPAEELGRTMAESMFNLTEKVTLPGTILRTNGTYSKNGTIQWDVGISELDEGYALSAKSRTINIPECLITALLFIAVAWVFVSIVRQ